MQAKTLRWPATGWSAACCLWLLALCSSPVLAQDALEDEALLKAAFIYNFAKFTRWPLDVWSGPKSPLILCTVGKDELVSSLEHLGKETIRGRPVIIRSFEAEPEGDECHVLYISGTKHRDFYRLLEQTQTAPILTISEIRGFADSGGVIQLYHAKNRIRFKINLEVANAKRLKLSARLLDLAEGIDTGNAK